MSDDEIVAWIADYLERNGYAPTTRELGDAYGVTSASTPWTRLTRLRREGRVDWVDGQNRTLHVVKKS